MDEGGSRDVASLSEEVHCGGSRERAPLLGTLGYGVMKGRLWGQASLVMGAHLGNLEWARLLGTGREAERGSGSGAFLSMGAV
jgi:hypothetical protein